MKKSLIAMMAVALFATSAMAQVLIYDYSVSYKLISDSLKKNVKCDVSGCASTSVKVTLDSPKVASSKLTGYMVINACDNCEGAMDNSTDETNPAVFYFYNKSSKTAVYRSVGTFRANMFSSKTGIFKATPHAGHLIGASKFSDASGAFEFPLDFDLNQDNYGFLGFATIADDSKVVNAGYGKVSKKTLTETTSEPCLPSVTTESTCWILKNLSGNTIVAITFQGYCSEFLFDICSVDADDLAPLVGTFSLKLNDKLTKGNYGTFAAAEEAILDKLNVTSVYRPEDDTKAAAFVPALIGGAYWD